LSAPTLVLVAAVADNGIIGRDGGLPWRLPADMKHFRELTMGHTLLMGRKTFDSLGKPLQGRDNWVLTRDSGYAPSGARVFHDLHAALREAPAELYVIGGAELYAHTLPLASRLELTLVHGNIVGDTQFPTYDGSAWRESARKDHAADEKHAHAYSFVTLVRAGAPSSA
jgi:dihydrofolate reductase